MTAGGATATSRPTERSPDAPHVGRCPERHDSVAGELIHDLFSVGLTLASCASVVGNDAVRDRLTTAIDELDRIIRDIRLAEVVRPLADGPIRRPELVDVDFVVPPTLGATTAELVAEFMAWAPLPMDRRSDGSFSVTLRLEAGRRWGYRFLLDGEHWVNDWSAPDYVVDDDGAGMSLLAT